MRRPVVEEVEVVRSQGTTAVVRCPGTKAGLPA
jgi:hypothetical protein